MKHHLDAVQYATRELVVAPSLDLPWFHLRTVCLCLCVTKWRSGKLQGRAGVLMAIRFGGVLGGFQTVFGDSGLQTRFVLAQLFGVCEATLNRH